MDEDQLAQRRFGQFRSRSGLIYGQWTEGDGTWEGAGNVCEPFDIPKEWTRFRGVDYGTRAPTAVLWGAYNAADDMLVIYREHYESEWTYEQHAHHCRELEAGEYIEAGWGDPNERGGIQIFNAHDVQTGYANNKVKPGIDAVKNRLRLALDGRPRLKVFRSCENLRRELRGYVWSGDGENPLKKNDHACDALRYMVSGIEAWRGF
jgi:phage terminase large subunit